MSTKRDDVVIQGAIAVLQDIASKMGENELLNAVAREALNLKARGKVLLANANPHVEDHEELVKWAQDCADLVDYISVATLRH